MTDEESDIYFTGKFIAREELRSSIESSMKINGTSESEKSLSPKIIFSLLDKLDELDEEDLGRTLN